MQNNESTLAIVNAPNQSIYFQFEIKQTCKNAGGLGHYAEESWEAYRYQ
jgi:hypothetical protein